MFLTSSVIADIVILVIVLTTLAYKYITRNKCYWKDRGVKYVEPKFLFGNISDIIFLRKSFGTWMKDLYTANNPESYFGILLFDEPALVVRSPEIVKDILVKDFAHFTDRSVAYPAHDEINRNMLFFQRGEEWKVLRSRLSPVFTSGKLKGMTPILNHYSIKLIDRLKKQQNGNVDVKEFISDYVMDSITKCFFGIECYGQEDRDSEFKLMLHGMKKVSLRIALSRLCFFFYQKLVNPLRLRFGDLKMLDYFCDAFLEAIKAREKSNIRVNDFIDIINDIRKQEGFAEDYNFTGRGALGQPFMFFIAGHGTTTATITFALYELSKYPDIQQKLREEILEMLEKYQSINYEALITLKYMDLCIQEILRMYPALPFIDRRCVKPYKIRNTDLVLPEDLSVYIPIMAFHYDAKYFPEPEKFIPERFLDKNNINNNGIFYAPFGDGPRTCIGERMGTMNVKMVLAHILSNFELVPAAGLPDKLSFDEKSFTLEVPPGVVQLQFKPTEK